MQSTLVRFAAATALGTAIFISEIVPAAAQALTGSWSGSGVIRLPSGEQERARCRVTFRPSGGGGYSMTATCATASTRVSQTAELSRLTTGSYAGEFFNAEHGVSGSIRVRVSGGGSLTASLQGGGGSATFTLSR